MSRWSVTGLFLVIFISYTTAQLPPRLQIPGASVASGGGARPAPFRAQSAPPPRLRRPNAIAASAREVRPVIEENEEPNYPVPTSAFEAEVNKYSSLTSAVREDVSDEEERPAPLPFRPERPIPIAREQIREKQRPLPPPRPVIRQDIREDPLPVRQAPVVRQQLSRPQPSPQTYRAPAKSAQRSQSLEDDEDLRDRRRKPVVQILRKYRTDNEDGSITWGFENDDGTFKEETLGADCVIRGNYGYVDPDGVKREFSYETGNKCDEPEEEEELLPQKPNIPQSRNKPLPQYRPAPQPVQFAN